MKGICSIITLPLLHIYRQMLVHQKQLNEALAECTTARKSIQR